MTWTFTDDPNDPCGLCVSWEEGEDSASSDIYDSARPVWPDGTTVERIYRFTHRDCTKAAVAYTIEAIEESAR